MDRTFLLVRSSQELHIEYQNYLESREACGEMYGMDRKILILIFDDNPPPAETFRMPVNKYGSVRCVKLTSFFTCFKQKWGELIKRFAKRQLRKYLLTCLCYMWTHGQTENRSSEANIQSFVVFLKVRSRGICDRYSR